MKSCLQHVENFTKTTKMERGLTANKWPNFHAMWHKNSTPAPYFIIFCNR